MGEFRDKIAFITGATAGIGRETAIRFAKKGAKVAVTGRREKEGAETVELIKKAGSEGLFLKSDVSVENEIQSAINQTVETFGGINFVFTNAGVLGELSSIQEETSQNIDQIIDINIKGVLYTIKHAAKALKDSGGGVIINNSSILGYRGMPSFTTYVASKFAVRGITQSAAIELASDKIRVNAIAPGPIRTEMLDHGSGGEPEKFGEALPLQRIGETKEIADAVTWLCSEEASFITGQVLPVDGGFTA